MKLIPLSLNWDAGGEHVCTLLTDDAGVTSEVNYLSDTDGSNK